ncbi:MAG: alpha/beta fold hydrolase [Terriglobales bacterium]
MPEPFLDESPGQPSVRGFLHPAKTQSGKALVLTHGAGANCNSPLLVALAESFCAAAVTVLRCDLPFRQARPHGPPLGTTEKDEAGLRRAIAVLRERIGGSVFLGGHSYGGRMGSMLLAQGASTAEGLLLLSYPLHPPRKPLQLRTAHFPRLRTPALFVHGTRDPFGSPEEVQSALALIPGRTKLLTVEGAGHELLTKSNRERFLAMVVAEFETFFSTAKQERASS